MKLDGLLMNDDDFAGTGATGLSDATGLSGFSALCARHMFEK